ncbi:zinc ion binding / nucleic acid binding protein [Thalictrum thalictroides]|uniref:Zinc ion binding / nucleic acid binding protein n=1 Tax=Thalictrum thalictroides TaxID=46969 RepID=A0A7J6WAY7_THATH|nr:zinc ion binding / nucleic acid binding protein [Thalictrum thalictroides]
MATPVVSAVSSPAEAMTTQEKAPLSFFGIGERRNQVGFGGNAHRAMSVLPTKEVMKETVEGSTAKKSYASAAKPRYGRNVDISDLPSPGKQGDFPTVSLIDEEVEKGLDFCKLSLVGRLDLQKITLARVRSIAAEIWSPKGGWMITPLGRGYIMVRFEDEDDYMRVWEQVTWLFDKQVLRLSKWSPNFSIDRQVQSHAAVWVKFPGLSLEYWEVKNLLAMGKALGRPLHVDETTAKREMGYYASVYVDIDLSQHIPDKIWVESKKHGVAFWQKVQLGKLPDFCNHCKGVGHLVGNCRFLKKDLAKAPSKAPVHIVQQDPKGKSVVQSDIQVDTMSKSQKKKWRKKNKNQAAEKATTSTVNEDVQEQLEKEATTDEVVIAAPPAAVHGVEKDQEKERETGQIDDNMELVVMLPIEPILQIEHEVTNCSPIVQRSPSSPEIQVHNSYTALEEEEVVKETQELAIIEREAEIVSKKVAELAGKQGRSDMTPEKVDLVKKKNKKTATGVCVGTRSQAKAHI